VLAAGVRGIEVRLNDQGEAAADDAIAVLAAQRGLHARDALIRNPLHQTHVEANLVPLHDSSLNLEEGKADRRLPVLGAFEDQVVEGVTNLRVLASVGIGEVVCARERRRREYSAGLLWIVLD
tara:strand:- start:256 stop:624 length:369 start_codon:yes stop_codon:yes gene_type:complete